MLCSVPLHHSGNGLTLLVCPLFGLLSTCRIIGRVIVLLLMAPSVEGALRICSSTQWHLLLLILYIDNFIFEKTLQVWDAC